MKHALPIAILAITFSAAADVVPTDKGTFTVAKKKVKDSSATSAAMAEEARAEALAYCGRSQKSLESVNTRQMVKYEKGEDGRMQPEVVGVSMEFKCLAK